MVLYGKKSFLDNIDSISNVIIDKRNSSFILLLKNKNIPFKFGTKKDFDIPVNHQGIISYTKDSKKINNLDDFIANKSNKNKLIVLLDSILDPGNFGSIIRTCEAFGVDCIIYKKDNQVQINDTVIKVSQGSINNINLFKVTNLSQTIDLLKNNGFWIYSSCLQDKSEPYTSVKYENNVCLIIGSEEKGISNNLINKSDFLIKIPMHGKVQSLNAAVSCAILVSYIKCKK